MNLITQSGGGPARADVSLTAGSFGTYAGEASWQGEMDGWRWYAGGAHETEKGWRQVTTAGGCRLSGIDHHHRARRVAQDALHARAQE